MTIPDALARALCEQINLWDGGTLMVDEDEMVEHWLAPVIAEALAAERATTHAMHEATLSKIRELHPRTSLDWLDGRDWCASCRENWPCSTLKALPTPEGNAP